MMQRFSIDDIPATQWKNGGGTTREIVRQPVGAGMDSFDWRVSVATITAAGPFSAFPGISRVIMLLDGAGVHLYGTSLEHRLATPLVPFPFSGDVALDCVPLDGATTDFNVMTRRDKLRATIQVLHTAGDIAPAKSGLLLAQGGAWQISSSNSDGPSLTCMAGNGGWWQGREQGWRVRPKSPDVALIVVQLYELNA